MSHNAVNMYDVTPHIAEIYDQTETYTDDVQLLQSLIGHSGPLRVLEPFCGTGRILLPLALDGHTVVGLDQAQGMLDRAQSKICQLPEEVQRRVTLIKADIITVPWPPGFDLVILGGNCLYELATPAEQETCVRSAAAALKPGGYAYVDNNHMEGELSPGWQKTGISQGFPSGTCLDGTRVESTTETVGWDALRRLVRFRRCTKVVLPDGRSIAAEYVQQKHPVSVTEVRTWLERHGLCVRQLYGDRKRSPYTENSPRAIFWAESA